MKKYAIILSFIMMVVIAAPASALITYDNTFAYGNGGYTSPYAGAIVETFDPSGALTQPGWTFSLGSNYSIRTGDSSGYASAPWWTDPVANPSGSKDETFYLTVPANKSVTPVSATIMFGGAPYNYLGLWWGSMDTYNTLELLAADGVTAVETYTGGTWSAGNGLQEDSTTNMYRNLYGMPNFYGVRITSTDYAFELDNLAVGYNVVPEPTTMLLLGLGLLGMAGVRRFRK